MPFNNMKFRIPMNLQHFAEPTDPPNEPQDPPAEPPNEPNPEPKKFDEDYVKKLRDEAAKYRNKAKDLEEGSKKKQQDLMKQMAEALGFDYNPDVELQKQLDVAKREAQEAKQNAHNLLMQANIQKVGASFEVGEGEEVASYTLIDPEIAFMVIDKDNLKVDEKGQVEGVQEEMKKLFSAKPHLFAPLESGTQQQQTPPKPNSFKPGTTQKINKTKETDGYQAGVSAYQRLKEKGKIRKNNREE